MDEVWIEDKNLLTLSNFHIDDTLECCSNCKFSIGDYGGGIDCRRYNNQVCATGICNEFEYSIHVSKVYFNGNVLESRVRRNDNKRKEV